MKIKDTRVYLRALEPDDYKTSIQWRNDADVTSQLGGGKIYVSESSEKKWVEAAIADTHNIRLAVCLKENNQYIGNVYITDINTLNRSGNSHILIGDKSCWGKGLSTEAYLLLLEYAFEERGMHRLVAHVLEENAASIALHKKCGYKQEGTYRKSVYKNGKWHDQIVFGILEEDYFSKRE